MSYRATINDPYGADANEWSYVINRDGDEKAESWDALGPRPGDQNTNRLHPLMRSAVQGAHLAGIDPDTLGWDRIYPGVDYLEAVKSRDPRVKQYWDMLGNTVDQFEPLLQNNPLAHNDGLTGLMDPIKNFVLPAMAGYGLASGLGGALTALEAGSAPSLSNMLNIGKVVPGPIGQVSSLASLGTGLADGSLLDKTKNMFADASGTTGTMSDVVDTVGSAVPYGGATTSPFAADMGGAIGEGSQAASTLAALAQAAGGLPAPTTTPTPTGSPTPIPTNTLQALLGGGAAAAGLAGAGGGTMDTGAPVDPMQDTPVLDSAGNPVGGNTLLPNLYPNNNALGGTAATGTAASRVIDQLLGKGTASTADWTSVLGTLGATGLGMYGANQTADTLKSMYDSQKAERAPFLTAATNAMNNPESWYQSAPAQGATEAVLRKLSMNGNPAGNPADLAKAAAYNLGGYNNFVNSMGSLGLSGQASQAQLGSNIAQANGGMYDALGFGLNQLTRQPKSLADILGPSWGKVV